MKISVELRFLLLLSAFLMISCGSDDLSTSPTSSSSCEPKIDGYVVFSDASGDAQFSFIDLTNLSVSLTPSSVKVELTLLTEPFGLSYNNVNVQDNSREYDWSVIFDIGANRKLRLSSSNYKFAGSEEAVGDVPYFTQNNVWLENDDGGRIVGQLTPTVTGATISLLGDTNLFPSLLVIDTCTPMRFESSYNASGTYYKDSYPNDDSWLSW